MYISHTEGFGYSFFILCILIFTLSLYKCYLAPPLYYELAKSCVLFLFNLGDTLSYWSPVLQTGDL